LHTPWKAPPDVLARAGVELGVTYPRRIISDLAAARRTTVVATFSRAFHAASLFTSEQVDWLLDARRAALHMNDSGGYDIIALPSGRSTRIFTKEEFRLGADGLVKPPPPRDRSRAKVPAPKFKSVKVAQEGVVVAAGSCGAGDCVDSGRERGLAAVASQSHVTEYFGKGGTAARGAAETERGGGTRSGGARELPRAYSLARGYNPSLASVTLRLVSLTMIVC